MKKKVNGNGDEGTYVMDIETGDENQLQDL